MTTHAIESIQANARDLAVILRRRRSHAHRNAQAIVRKKPRIAVIASGDSIAQIPDELKGADIIAGPATDVSKYDLLIADFTLSQSPRWAAFLSRAALTGCSIRHAAEYLESDWGRVSLPHFSPAHLPKGGRGLYPPVKRMVDLVAVIAFAPLVIPVILLASAAIGLSMGGPIFFVQERVGRYGKTFRMFKLRTMQNASNRGRACATTIGDKRITRLGSFLRRFRIDELPQFLNVLRGDMSLIGPRPEQPALSAHYAQELPGFDSRHLVRPGITGWAQVKAGYAADVAETRIKLSYDLFYVKNASAMLDTEIALRTVRTLLFGGSAR